MASVERIRSSTEFPGSAVALERNMVSTGRQDRADTEASGEPSLPEKKPKACLNCRRSKHRCLPSTDPRGRCVRCLKRKEDCKFRTRLHDDEWQEWVTDELKTMMQTVESLKATIDDLKGTRTRTSRPPLNMSQSAPAEPPRGVATQVLSDVREPMFSSDMDVQTEAVEYASQSHGSISVSPDAPQRAMSVLTTSAMPESTAPVSESRPFTFGPGVDVPTTRSSSMIPQQQDAPIFMSIAGAANLLSELGSISQTAPGELQFTNDELGSSDPRPNVIHKGVLEIRSANVLFDYFVENISPMLPGFVIRVGEYPFLAAGKSTITPYILSVMTLIAAERLPAFHEKVPPLTMETSVACPLGLSIAAEPHMESVYEAGGSEGEPFFNVELGIGPEEITGMSLIASFSTSSDSHIAAKAALEWARGFAKGDDGQATRVLTLGEMCGYLSPRRWPARAQSHRLILFTFVIAVQQSVYRAARLPLFNPGDICDELGWASRTKEEVVQDNVLIAHVRLGMILQAWQAATSSMQANPTALVDDYNRYLDQWVAQLDQACIAAEHRDLLAPIWLYARIIINMVGSNDSQHGTASLCTRNAMRAARSLLDVFVSPRMMDRLPLLPPFHIEIFSLGCTLLLMRMSKLVQRPTSGDDELVLDAIDSAARRLLQGPLPRGHFAPQAGERLQTAVLGIKQRWRSA